MTSETSQINRLNQSGQTLRQATIENGEPLTNKTQLDQDDAGKPSVTLPGTVEKIIPPTHPSQPEKAQIGVEGADDLYRELRVENTLQDENGKPVALKPGAKVDVTIEADLDATHPKQTSG